jgi:hypothetical protein
MQIFKFIKKELIPLNKHQQIILLVLIASIFQFVLFYTPALADEAVKQSLVTQSNQEEDIIINDSIIKTSMIGPVMRKLIGPIKNTSTPIEEKSPVVKIIKTSSRMITAYNSEAAQTDDSPCITANGFNVCQHGQEDTVAANFLKFGTRIKIP